MHEWPQKTRQNDKHARPASVQPCGGEITEYGQIQDLLQVWFQVEDVHG